MHTIHLKAVDSRYATPEELDAAGITADQIPQDWRVMAHQAKTYRALQSDADIIINRAMTGDGKSFAGQLPLFLDRWPIMTLYPTNELARDQERAVKSLLAGWTPPRWQQAPPIINVLNAARLDEEQDARDGFSRAETLRLLLDHDLLLSNPDMFHYMAMFRYERQGAAADLILSNLMERYQMFVFDEFHLFGSPQVASALIAILLMRELMGAGQRRRFLMLSATPQDLLMQHAERAGLRVQRIEGEYQHGLTTEPPGWRRILQPVTLYLDTGKLEDWVEEHWEDVILRFFEDHRPGAKGVIIANGVATANRLLVLLRARLPKHIQVAINTGLTPLPDRGRNFDLLVATSTVDVGVDFRINLLIFESVDAAAHIQRLGRLGRHLDDGKGNKFDHFEAHAMLPGWVVEGIAAELPDGSEVDRECYKIALEKVYPPLQQFSEYLWTWAGLQASHIISMLHRKEIRTQYQPFRDRLKEQYSKLFRPSLKTYLEIQKEQPEILNEATSFRGGSPFTALVQDMTSESRAVMAYNLITLLMNTELESVPLKALYRYEEEHGRPIRGLERAEPLAGYRLLGWLPKPRPVEITLDRRVADRPELFDSVIAEKGFRISAPGVPEIPALNRKLEGQKLVALLLPDREPEELRRKLKLGYQIELFKFSSTDSVQGCAAFGRDALLLHSVLFRFKRKPNDKPFIF
jgi:CRISPR-associated endonuclease/helicase Cas3